MTGIEAITLHNGWAMAVVGATIVISGLAILALIISQLHNIIDLLEKKKKVPGVEVSTEILKESNSVDKGITNIEFTLELYQPLFEELDEQFQLADLYELAKRDNLPHPHISIRCMCESGNLCFLGNGTFSFLK
ncbi:OadG family protein [Desulforhopalus vacuolatus]|uniref:OadG family protein n=1 Tax=Desulforhopalus vacuolatus TaxID=40414 RepID=UPI001963FECE|nr:OadG family protein [Desulforhopalus vacuolatus]MBM9519900.1 OadG family protein [Desulforhopalus vacuolatus]